MELILIGTNHTSAPAGIRDTLHMEAAELAHLYPRLRGLEEVTESAVLSTCHRTEVLGWVDDVGAADGALREAVTAQKGVPYMEDGDYTYLKMGREAVHHLYSVAAGLDSLMIGEPEILGQVKDALAYAENNGTAGTLLHKLFEGAVHTGKRARAETGVGEGALSVAYAAVGLASKVFADMNRHRVLVVGAGETGALAGRHFADLHPAALTVVNRTLERGQALAEELGGRARPWEERYEALEEADVVVTATSAPEPVIRAAELGRVMKARSRRPMVVVDIASPRDVDPKAAGLDNVFLYDLDALESVVEQNRARRAKEIPKAERIVSEEVDRFFTWHDTLEVAPIIRAFRQAFTETALAEAEKQAKHFQDKDREMLQKYTRSLVNKLLHHPTVRIKEIDRSSRSGLAKLEAVTDLFDLDLGPPPGRGSSEEDDEGADAS
ncbi:MAG: glutamyl-tRNA reductase [bacterium]